MADAIAVTVALTPLGILLWFCAAVTVAVRVFVPIAGPSVQLPGLAMPIELVAPNDVPILPPLSAENDTN